MIYFTADVKEAKDVYANKYSNELKAHTGKDKTKKQSGDVKYFYLYIKKPYIISDDIKVSESGFLDKILEFLNNVIKTFEDLK